MSILTNQTAINFAENFFTTASTTGVETVTAGSNLSLSGTLTNPTVNFPGPFVTSITAGSNITVTNATVGGAVTTTINSVGGEDNSASYANPNVITLTLPTINVNGIPNVGFINPALYPNLNKLYRVTICYEYASATFATTPVGSLTLSLFATVSPSPLILCNHSIPFSASLANGNQNIGGILTAVFRPVPAGGGGSASLFLSMLNNTTAVLSGALIVFNVFSVEEITDNFTLISSAILPPP